MNNTNFDSVNAPRNMGVETAAVLIRRFARMLP